MKSIKSKVSSMLACVGTSVTIGVSSILTSHAPASAQATTAKCYFYKVTLQGTVTTNYGTKQFSVPQYAIWRDRGIRGNSVEFMLKAFQDLNVSPKVGQIEFLTNSRYANNTGIALARIDLAKVAVANNQVVFTLDSGASLQMPAPNVFIGPGVGTSAGGLGGIGFLTGGGAEIAKIINGAEILQSAYLVPRQGSGVYRFTDSSATKIVGQIDFAGTASDNFNEQGRYTASFSGDYVGSTDCEG